MCRRVDCSRCGRPTYAGCGAHVEQVLGNVPPAERCHCREAKPTGNDTRSQAPRRSWLGGLFGKGGSAVATPLLYLVGVPAIAAVASPLPATIPGTLVAADAYRRAGMIDRRTVLWSCGAGLPATVLGALATKWIDGSALVVATPGR